MGTGHKPRPRCPKCGSENIDSIGDIEFCRNCKYKRDWSGSGITVSGKPKRGNNSSYGIDKSKFDVIEDPDSYVPPNYF